MGPHLGASLLPVDEKSDGAPPLIGKLCGNLDLCMSKISSSILRAEMSLHIFATAVLILEMNLSIHTAPAQVFGMI